jgi:exodeoxyribonuclease-3
MKIITWNVNGLRAVLKKGALGWLWQQDADVICLQEIKAKPEQLSEEDHDNFGVYQAYWNPAQRPGYSGVVTLSREKPQEIAMGLNHPDFDLEGRVVCTRYSQFYLFNIYFPNGQRSQARVDYKLAFYARLLEICEQLHAKGEKIVLCGDFNTAHREIDLKNARQNSNTSGFLPEERAWIDRYLESRFVDIFRQRYPERVQYTWWTYIGKARERNTGWRLDYYLVSDALAPYVIDTVIHDDVPGSDHCPVSLILT